MPNILRISDEIKEAIISGPCSWVKQGKLLWNAIQYSKSKDNVKFEFMFGNVVVAHMECEEIIEGNTLTLDLHQINTMKIEIS